jgi:hypothetical protein
MSARNRRYYFGHDLQEFTDVAITDPVYLAKLAKQDRRRPRKLPRWAWRLIFGGSVLAALLVGILLGRFVC